MVIKNKNGGYFDAENIFWYSESSIIDLKKLFKTRLMQFR